MCVPLHLSLVGVCPITVAGDADWIDVWRHAERAGLLCRDRRRDGREHASVEGARPQPEPAGQDRGAAERRARVRTRRSRNDTLSRTSRVCSVPTPSTVLSFLPVRNLRGTGADLSDGAVQEHRKFM